MKRKEITIKKVLIFLMTIAYGNLLAQSGQLQGSSTSIGNLYQEKHDIGVGSADMPKARVHIFNGLTNLHEPMARNKRPLLITGFNTVITGTLPNGNVYYHQEQKNYFTVSEQGFVGIDVLNPLTKLHLHKGIFTFSDGSLMEPIRWDVSGTEESFAIKDYNSSSFRFWINKSDGFIGIGTEDPDEKLHVEDGNVLINNGALIVKGQNVSVDSNNPNNQIILQSDGYIRAREIKVDLDDIPHPDYVFKSDYKLMSLQDLKAFVEKNKHLPNVKSEAEFQEEGSYSLGELNLKLLEKVEELTLYIIQLEERLSKVELRGGVK